MPNSTIKVRDIFDYACGFPEIAPVLNPTVGGYSTLALKIADDVANDIFSPKLNWKWNRFNVPVFYTNSWQQDYASNTSTLAWLEHGFMVDINNSAYPKPVYPIEVVRDLEKTSGQFGRCGQVCWLPNDQLIYGTWGAGGPQNPGALQTITNPLGAVTTPTNPLTQVIDTNGNFQVVTTYGTTGASLPSWPSANAAVGTITNDGSVRWTVVDPKGQGFRVNPLPPQSGVVFQMNLVGQMRQPLFTSPAQTLEPMTDDFSPYFKQGFVAHCYRRSPNPATRAKFAQEWQLWMDGMLSAVREADRERDSAGFYPSQGIMDSGYYGNIGPANPYGYGW